MPDTHPILAELDDAADRLDEARAALRDARAAVAETLDTIDPIVMTPSAGGAEPGA